MRRSVITIAGSASLILLTIILIGCSVQKKAPQPYSITKNDVLQKNINVVSIPEEATSTREVEGDISEDIKDYSETSSRKLINYENISEVKIPVLMFHSIKSNGKNDLIISPVEFQRKMKWLKDNNYSTLSMDELYSMLKTGKNVPERPIVLTFDDGYDDNYTNAYPILKNYNFKATVFLVTNNIGARGYLKSEQIKEMSSNKIDFQSHTARHQELNTLSYKEQLNELKKSKAAIEDLINKNADALCYPVGKYNAATINAAKEAGYKMCFTTKPGFSKINDGIYTLTRVRVFPGFLMESIKRN